MHAQNTNTAGVRAEWVRVGLVNSKLFVIRLLCDEGDVPVPA